MDTQKKKLVYIIAGVVIVAAIAIVIWLTIGSQKEPFLVSADDGSVTLEIPRTALPNGVSADDVKITKIDPSDVFENPSDAEDLLAFKLEPDGLQLSKPATVTITHEGSGVPVIYHISGDSTEILDNVTVKIDDVEGTTSVTGEISHFSTVISDRSGFFRLIVDPKPISVDTGDSFPVKFFLEPSREIEERRITGLKTLLRYAPFENYQVNMDGSDHDVFASRQLSPQRTRLEPADLAQHEKYIKDITFTCNEPGEPEIRITGQGIHIKYMLEEREFVGENSDQLRWTREYGRTTRIEYRTRSGCIYRGEPPEDPPPPPPEEPELEFVRIGPQYLVTCTDENNVVTAVLTGYHAIDDAGNPLSDALGNPVDSETGQPVICP